MINARYWLPINVSLFWKRRLEPFAEVRYIDPANFCRDVVADADGMLIRTRTRCNFEMLHDTSVKFIATATIGTDQIDIPYCKSRGIDVNNSPGCNAPGVAQYVWASLLHCGINPEQMTVGIIGCGNVGSVVAEWGEHLGAKLLINDPLRQNRNEQCLHGKWHSLEEVLEQSDIVTLHVPLTRCGEYATHHLLGERELSMMKQGAILINAARGPVCDNEAVARVAENGKIRTIIDTWEGEPENINRRLLKNALIATPHIAGYSLEGKQRATRMILEATERFFGFEGIDYSGLAERYTARPEINAEMIKRSYNPCKDMAKLKAEPERFEQMRDTYNYRPEP